MMKKMKKRWIGLLVLFAVLTGICPLMANAGRQSVYDMASLFNAEESARLEGELLALQTQSGYDVVIATTNDANGKSARDYADDFYDENGFGTGSEKSGVLLLLDMDNREIWISTSGAMIDILNDSRIEAILDDVYDGMVNAEYMKAAEAFLQNTEYYIGQGIEQGQYRETVKEAKPVSKAEQAAKGFFYGLIGGAVISGIICLVIARKYKGRRGKGEYTYQQNGNLHLVKQNDLFLHQTVTHRHIPKNPPPQNHSSSGRSSVHHSSSGRTHGGGGRKF